MAVKGLKRPVCSLLSSWPIRQDCKCIILLLLQCMVYEKKGVSVHEHESTLNSPAQSVMAATLCSCTVTLWDFNSQACRSSLTPQVWYCDWHWTLLPSLPSDTYLGLVQKGHGEAEDCCVPVSWSPQHASEAQAMVAECGLLALQQSLSCLPCQQAQITHTDSGSHSHVFPANKHRSYRQWQSSRLPCQQAQVIRIEVSFLNHYNEVIQVNADHGKCLWR